MKPITEILKTEYGDFITFGNEQISNCLRRGQYWDQHLSDVFKKYVSKESIVVEVGANLGFHTIHLSHLARRIYTFEPQKYVFYQLCANILLNNCFNVIAENAAVSNSNQNFFMPDTFSRYNGEELLAATHSAVPAIDGHVRGVTLDSVIKDKVNFIKIDAQGADLAVMQGAEILISNYKPIICFEYEKNLARSIYKHKWLDYIAFLEKHNYQVIEQFGDSDYLAGPK